MKHKTSRDSKYLEFVRSRPCVVTGEESNRVVAHHVRCLGGGGIGLKPSDYVCIPLTAEQHSRLHHMGEKSFWQDVGINPEEVITMTILVYLARIRVSYKNLIDLLECLK